MGSLKGVNIQRGTIGASVDQGADAITGLLATGVAVAADAANGISGIALGQTVRLTSLTDAEAYGINESYDSTNSLSVYRHISEFYRMFPNGTLYLMLYSGDMEAAFAEQYAKKLIIDANGEIRILGIANTPAAATEEYLNGFPEDVFGSIQLGQQLYDWAFSTFRPCQIILEGRDFNAANAASALDLRNITISNQVLEAFKVSVCIAQDWKFADGLDAIRKKMADLGTMLGSIAKKAVNENIGEVEGGNLVDTTNNKWLVAGLSNHQTVAGWDSQLEALDSKGYIFAISYTGIAGYYWNNDHTCTPIKKDKDGYFNEYTISYGRVHDKAVRDLRTCLLPKVKSTQPVDPDTGKLPQALVTYFERLADDDVFNAMAAEGLITAGKTTVDPDSDLLISPRELKVSFVLVPTGQIDEIKGTINLKTSI
ncbi:MAG: hypothetical protein IJQ32_00370 [Paludibacteraceae bacterium]|nr:hypothetical protein [Paludibacteraceae bacterium]